MGAQYIPETPADLTMATGKILGRVSDGTGPVEEIILGNGLSMTGNTLNAAGGGGGVIGKLIASTTLAVNGLSISLTNLNLPEDESKRYLIKIDAKLYFGQDGVRLYINGVSPPTSYVFMRPGGTTLLSSAFNVMAIPGQGMAFNAKMVFEGILVFRETMSNTKWSISGRTISEANSMATLDQLYSGIASSPVNSIQLVSVNNSQFAVGSYLKIYEYNGVI